MSLSLKGQYRKRLLIEDVGTNWVEANVAPAAPGVLLRFFASADAAEDAEATIGTTGASDLAVQVVDLTTGFVILEYDFAVVNGGEAPVEDLTVDAVVEVQHFHAYKVRVRLNADALQNADGVVAVEIYAGTLQ